MGQRLAVRSIDLPGTAPLGLAYLGTIPPQSRRGFIVVGNMSCGISHIDGSGESIEYVAENAVSGREALDDMTERMPRSSVACRRNPAEHSAHGKLVVG